MRQLLVTLVVVGMSASTLAGAQPPQAATSPVALSTGRSVRSTIPVHNSVSGMDAHADTATPNVPPPDVPAQQRPVRPAVLPMLYASYAALQAYDAYSTRRGIALGARETNPLMQHVADNTEALVAVKVSVVVATILAAERLWKTNKPAAIAVMVASNSVAAIVAARNAYTLNRLH